MIEIFIKYLFPLKKGLNYYTCVTNIAWFDVHQGESFLSRPKCFPRSELKISGSGVREVLKLSFLAFSIFYEDLKCVEIPLSCLYDCVPAALNSEIILHGP
jgi:hypothetical protein